MKKGTKSKAAEELVAQFEIQWEQKKTKQAEELHNDIAKIIAEHSADMYTVLFVLEVLRFETLQTQYEKLFSAKV